MGDATLLDLTPLFSIQPREKPVAESETIFNVRAV